MKGRNCYLPLQIVSVKVPDPEFEGQTKARLGNPCVKALTAKVVSESLEDFLRLNTDTLRVVVEKALLAQKAADAAKRAREMVKRKTVLTRAMLPGKLADCSNQDSHSAEIFIVEGDSAGGSAKQVAPTCFRLRCCCCLHLQRLFLFEHRCS